MNSAARGEKYGVVLRTYDTACTLYFGLCTVFCNIPESDAESNNRLDHDKPEIRQIIDRGGDNTPMNKGVRMRQDPLLCDEMTGRLGRE